MRIDDAVGRAGDRKERVVERRVRRSVFRAQRKRQRLVRQRRLDQFLRMPVVIQTRKYDDDFYSAMAPWSVDPVAIEARRENNARTYRELFGSDDDDD